jgi:hypothetical protein
MLVQVTFLAPASPGRQKQPSQAMTRIAAPRVLLEGSGERASV